MKKITSFSLILILAFFLLGCEQTRQLPFQETDISVIENLVEDFGSKLQVVSLLAPEEQLNKSMQENYGPFVSPELLEKWQVDPLNAPGRLTSSPWPDRIEILNIKKLADEAYQVEGEIIEITSEEESKGGIAARRPLTLVVEKKEAGWLITAVILGEYADNNTEYRNSQYGFTFKLPESWQGYSIEASQWEGFPPGGSKSIANGPLFSIRHPEWTEAAPRQDIPIMVFTLAQWQDLQDGKFHIGAAPIGPSELGRNRKYVFALPARYNYAFPPGYEEVEVILQGNPLMANDDFAE